jgi:hypothetical protein
MEVYSQLERKQPGYLSYCASPTHIRMLLVGGLGRGEPLQGRALVGGFHRNLP